ncbi:MAG: YifB family Mg chelatase-like AAA ATPase [Paludibacteraceae bacterium]|nr:YifB family Mg chelatase-like AAA ATPase [Paludibacteraceae bacterium]
MLIKCFGAAPQGIDAVIVTIEVHAVPGFEFTLVGLPDNAVKESHERIVAALTVNGYNKPRHTLTINMAPADIKKEGAAYDLPLAIGMLAAEEEVKTADLEHYMIMGELSLDGTLQPIQAVLPMALAARKAGFKGIILPEQNAREAAVVKGLEVYGMKHLLDVVRFLNGTQIFEPTCVDTAAEFAAHAFTSDLDFSDVRGQENVRRAMEVAAAGGHNMLMVGPPGAGKSMMAKRMPSILPPLNLEEALETTKIYSVAGMMARRKESDGMSSALIVQRPFRSPHHTVTDVALVGGGTNPHPGEISLAHHGVLFLDELPEYKRSALEVMRQPLEDRKICVTRTKMSVEYPASFMLVAAMNPCPCGHYGENNPAHPCTCTPAQIHRYMSRISGPLLDRIDIQCDIQAVPYSTLKDAQPGESSAVMRERVIRARKVQEERFATYNQTAKSPVHCNAQMTPKLVREHCQLDAQSDKMLSYAMDKMGLSARAYDRILKVARTIADLDNSTNIQIQHISEAISYRSLDREDWI